jgi:hypothetical protein
MREVRQERTSRVEDARWTNGDRMRKEREDAEFSRKSRLRAFGLHGWLVMPRKSGEQSLIPEWIPMP